MTIENVKVNDLQMQTLTVTFNTVVGAKYVVKVSSSLTAADDQWSVEYVSQNKGGAWSDFSTDAFMAGSEQTQIRIPINTEKSKAFFRIFKVEE